MSVSCTCPHTTQLLCWVGVPKYVNTIGEKGVLWNLHESGKVFSPHQTLCSTPTNTLLTIEIINVGTQWTCSIVYTSSLLAPSRWVTCWVFCSFRGLVACNKSTTPCLIIAFTVLLLVLFLTLVHVLHTFLCEKTVGWHALLYFTLPGVKFIMC